MFTTDISTGKRIISRRRASQVKKESELRAFDCAHYLTRCLPAAAFKNQEAMACPTCRLNSDTSGAMSATDIDFLYEVATARRLLDAIFNGGKCYDSQ